MTTRVTYTLLTLAALLMPVGNVLAQSVPIVGVAGHAFNDPNVSVVLANGDLYAANLNDATPTWGSVGNLLASTNRPGERIVGLVAMATLYDYHWAMTSLGYLCINLSCTALENRTIFEVTGRPPQEVVAFGSNSYGALYAVTVGGDVYLLAVQHPSIIGVSYKGNLFGAVTGNDASTWGTLKALYRGEPR